MHFNKVILCGHLSKEIELKYFSNGNAYAKSGIAVNRHYKKQDGSEAQEVCFIDLTLFNKTAQIAHQYLKKGSAILIEGSLVLESWSDESGNKKSKHSIRVENMQMLGKKEENNGGQKPPEIVYENAPQNQTSANEEIPF